MRAVNSMSAVTISSKSRRRPGNDTSALKMNSGPSRNDKTSFNENCTTSKPISSGVKASVVTPLTNTEDVMMTACVTSKLVGAVVLGAAVVGVIEGIAVGNGDGSGVGKGVGDSVGESVGISVGIIVGMLSTYMEYRNENSSGWSCRLIRADMRFNSEVRRSAPHHSFSGVSSSICRISKSKARAVATSPPTHTIICMHREFFFHVSVLPRFTKPRLWILDISAAARSLLHL